jgi:hypothetical protein
MNEDYKSLFVNLGSTKSQSLKFLSDEFPDPLSNLEKKPSLLVKQLFESIEKNKKLSNSTRGTLFEYLILLALLRKDISPIMYQASLTYVFDVRFDLILFNNNNPHVISCKTSARERYKQVELEAFVLKQVHKDAICTFILYDQEDVNNLRVKLKNREIRYIDKIICAQDPEFDDYIRELSLGEFAVPEPVEVVKGRITGKQNY